MPVQLAAHILHNRKANLPAQLRFVWVCLAYRYRAARHSHFQRYAATTCAGACGHGPNTSYRGVTSDVGGKVLTCFLIKHESSLGCVGRAGGIAAWLEKMAGAPTATFPAARLCVQKALKWLPSYEGCGSAPKAPKLFGDSDSETEF